MDKIIITNVQDMGNDVLLVEGVIGETPEGEEPNIIQAHGWVSTTTNHYVAQDYQEDGHRKENAQPRAMTDEEKHAYYQQLLLRRGRV